MIAPLIAISSDEGRIGRVGWTNQKAWGSRGRIWWSDYWPWTPAVARAEADRAEEGEP